MAGFNEAPIHESGKSPRYQPRRDRPARFNEAPIHESGKCGKTNEATEEIVMRFNEAPIHESGKWRSGYLGRQDHSGASMRPRFMNRGSNIPLRSDGSPATCFNEAPIHESGKYGQEQLVASSVAQLQ